MELEKRLAYITTPWWQSPAINIPFIKKQVIYLHNHNLVQKPALETLSYTNGSEINNKIGLACIILGQRKHVKKFLSINITSTVYMRKMQEIQDSLIYAMNQEETTSIRVFTDNQAALKAP